MAYIAESFPMMAAASMESGKLLAENTTADDKILQLLSGIPSPARKGPVAESFQGNSSQMTAANFPLPPPMPSAPTMQMQPPVVRASEAGMSYRDRLRAGGQGAFQRAFDIGLMPKTMQQDWNAASSVTDLHGAWPSQNMQHGMMTPFGTGMDGQQMWSNASQMQYQMSAEQMWNQASMPGCEQWSTMMPQPALTSAFTYPSPELIQIAPSSEKPPILATNGTTVHSTCLPPPSQLVFPEGADTASTELARCLAIIMPDSAQFSGDKEIMAAQLKAAADCQFYDD